MADGSITHAEFEQAGLRLAVEGAVATITLARPERRNALTFSTWRTLARIGDTLPDGVRVVVVRGEGPAFSAGIDLRLFTAEGVPGEDALAPRDEEFIHGLQAGYLWLRRPDIVSIAAVHGHAIGGGFQLALACDLRVVADDVKFAMKEPALGIVPDLTGTKPLVDIVGVPRALELCLTARTVFADEAARLGLAELVVPVADLGKAVDDLVAAILAVRPTTAVATKRLLRAAPGNTLEEQSAAERREQVALLRELAGERSS
ncbi:enoyl-CoA hydratase/isomerase family protein [Actinoallomurus iriomotensis]|uniref:Enoyl-CoA hydratase n=1 Tax=Actinoallomurus iriomotensis TaxID=478107 RepID=A0A9W6VQA0_9ACTN|nr:enoyl-CoA hydratase/isomerase family protein [Actinoallomurus iriomotensis]GLY76490.1 enoyl-CoA hydratase [Actinoallomurus iriomotensis]